MHWRSIYTYAWDFAEQNVQDSVFEFIDIGLNTVTIAGSYHAGKFLRPRAPGKVYFPEDGTVYFRHDPSKYGTIVPQPNYLLNDRDVLAELCDVENIAVNVWLVMMHNSLLGYRHPDICVENAFGDRYIYSLCPSADAAREYAIALARDVSETYEVSGLSIETPGFLPFQHGYHHEFSMVRPNQWLNNLLGLCFCQHCATRAESTGLDIAPIRAQVVNDISNYLKGDSDYPDDMAEAFWMSDILTDRALSEFLGWRCDTVTSLIEEIRSAVRRDVKLAVIPSVARPTANSWYEGSDLEGIAKSSGIVEACFYEPAVDRISADLDDIVRRLRGHGALRGILRPSYPDLDNTESISEAVKVLVRGGVEGISFYNWGFLRERNLKFIAEALAEIPR